jgi:hypothetical protein
MLESTIKEASVVPDLLSELWIGNNSMSKKWIRRTGCFPSGNLNCADDVHGVPR